MSLLHTEYTNQTIDLNKISEIDKKTRTYIEAHGNVSYDAIIAGETDWQLFYNLSELRTGILSWYDFAPDARVLEIGAGFGALTGRLCKMCAHVTATERSLYKAQAICTRFAETDNLDVYAGDVSDMEFPETFDYIVLIGLLERVGKGSSAKEPYAEYLKALRKLLKPRGRILLAVENRFGLRYFCGAVEPHTNRAFDGINHYRQGTGGYSFSRQEIEDVVQMAGFAYHKFYYPLPDYKLPQLIYTDAYLPEKNLNERLIPYYRRNDTLVASEQELYNDIVSNGVFPFFANSFLVECGEEDGAGQVVYAAVSTDRGQERSFATTIRAGGIVRKVPLYEEGRPNGRKLYGNIMDLQAHGIPVVEHSQVPGDGLELPFVSWPTLSNYIKEIFKDNVEEVLAILDKLYEYILQSSEQVPTEENALLGRLKLESKNPENDESGDTSSGNAESGSANSESVESGRTSLESAKSGSAESGSAKSGSTEPGSASLEDEKTGNSKFGNLDFGPILKKAYMELIPLNCFFDPETKQFLYFDQEFVRENYPAKYVLFRAIHYIYCFTPNAEQYYPRQKLAQKYHMEDTWEIYLQEENRFLDEVRNHKQYSQFYQWTRIDWKRILGNAKRLTSEAETVAEYKIPHKMKLTWKVELAMLDEVDRICKKYNLTYFLVHGSLLGAVRHKGFIPWDDDLDIALLRTDYDRFLEVAAEELAEPLSIQTPRMQEDVFWGGFARIRNGRTTGIEVKELGHKGNFGIWIDVLPLDVCTEDEKKFDRKEKKVNHYQKLIYAKLYGRDYKAFLGLKRWQWQACRLLAGFYSHEKLCGKLDQAMRLYTEEPSKDVAVFTGHGKHRRLNGKDFAETAVLDFEGRKAPVPAGYENYLFMSMGGDYLKYPPEEERKPRHRGIFDPEKPYQEYLDLLGGTFEDIKGKQIILFGSGMMFEDYMKKYGGKYRPAFLVDNDKNKWGRSRMGLEIKEPGAILEVPAAKRRVIICSFYYREISEQLDKMGIEGYKVYVQEMEWIVQTESQQGQI